MNTKLKKTYDKIMNTKLNKDLDDFIVTLTKDLKKI